MSSKRDVEIEMHDTMDRVTLKVRRLRASHDALLVALKWFIDGEQAIARIIPT